MEQKTNKILIIIIIVVLLLLIILLSTGIIDFNKNKYSNYEPNNTTENNNDDLENDNNNDNTEKNEENKQNDNTEENQTNDPSEYWLVNNDIITEEKTTELTFKITDNGKISINNNKTITNITNTKSIKLFSPAAPYHTLYILTKDGNIYKYETSELEKENYNATKVDAYTNIKEIVTYQKRSTENKGGCDYIVVIDKDNKHYKLDSMCI